MALRRENKFTYKHFITVICLIIFLLISRWLWYEYTPQSLFFNLFNQMFVALILLLHATYSIIVFLINRDRKEIIPFIFLLTFSAFTVLLDDDQALLYIISLSDETAFRLLFVFYMLANYAVIKFFERIRNKYTSQLLPRIFFILTSISILLFIFLPFQWINIAYIFSGLLSIGILIFLIYITFTVFFYENKLAFLLLLSIITSLHNLIWGIISNTLPLQLPYYPLDFLFSFLTLVAFLAYRFIQVAEERRKLNKTLQIINQEKVSFLENVSNELRNPLQAIINIAQSLETINEKNLNTKSKKNLKLITNLSKYTKVTLDDLLEQKTHPNQPIQIKQKPTNLKEIIELTFEAVTYSINKKEIELGMQLPEKLPLIWADYARMRQVLFNLLHFSIELTPKKGKITLKVDADESFVKIQIIDNGSGIAKKQLHALFSEKNYGKDHKHYSLYICKYLIKKHGGDLSVYSELNVGTSFTFTIPIATEKHKLKKKKSLPSQLEIGATSDSSMHIMNEKIDSQVHTLPKILVLDENKYTLKFIKQFLKNDYEITCTSNYKYAKKLFNDKHWDLIISDVHILKIHGYEWIQKIRKRFSLFELPILLLTNKSISEELQLAYLNGANDYVQKPINMKELQTRVKALTKLKRAVEEKLQMEAAWLQAQIQPHFLFNTINTIASLGHIDSDRMTRLLNEFGNYLQHSFHTNNIKNLIPLHQELALLRSYLYIEKERFGNRLNIVYNIDDSLQLLIPPLSIQPIVENAIRHGVLQKLEGGTIKITIQEKEKYYYIAIEDNGVGIPEKKIYHLLNIDFYQTETVGLRNTHRRLLRLYGKGVSIESEVNVGTKISFTIPKRKHINENIDNHLLE